MHRIEIMSFRIYIVSLLFWSFAGNTLSQVPGEVYQEGGIQQRDFDKKEWQNVIEGLDYSGDKEKEKKAESDPAQGRERHYNSNRDRPNFDLTFGTDFASFLLKALIVLFGLTICFLLIRTLIDNKSTLGFKRKKKPKDTIASSIDIKKIEENIHETDLERVIRQALEGKDYALAIRLYYLAGLKELSLKKAIKWKRDKTNRAYLNEMRENPLFETFRRVTAIFERVWYGSTKLDEQDFQRLEPQFKQFIQSINRKIA